MAATHLLVANPTAQSGKNAARIDRALDAFKSAGRACELLPTLPDGATIDAVRDAVDKGPYLVVVSMGGDGTFREVASGVLASGRREEVALGMLPTGTANDQGRSFGLEAADESLAGNVEVVVRARETRLDAGRVTALTDEGKVLAETTFFDSLGWGLSARTLLARNADRRFVEATPVLREVYADGIHHELTGLTDLIVKATRVYGGAWVFDRASQHDDGLFEVVPFRGKLDWTSKAIVDLDGNPISEQALNAIGVEHSKPFRASRLDFSFVHSPGGATPAAQIDGEEFCATPRAHVEVVARALRLIVP
jgi:diacylglycerol kinase family enzyme